MAGVVFTKDFGDILVEVDGKTNQIRVVGPKRFVEGIDWDGVMDSARLLAVNSPSAYMAIALAVQMKYAAWKGTQSILALGRVG